MAHTLMNDRTRSAVALDVDIAASRAERRRGLLGRDHLSASEGLLLTPCIAVHTAFMRFTIDVVFIDRDGRAVRVVPKVRPWRMTACLRGHSVIELAAGTAAAADIRVGDFLYLAPAPPPLKKDAPSAERQPC